MGTIHGSLRGTTKPTVICLHASGGSGAQWKSLADCMRHDFHVLTPDLHGHGMAPEWHGAPADIVAADTERVARLVFDAVGDVHLVGHSYGGAITLRVAWNHPGKVTSIAVYEPVAMRALFDHNPKDRPAVEVAEVATDMRRALDAGSPEHAARRFMDYWSGAGYWMQLAPERKASITRRMAVIHAHFVSLFGDAVRLSDYASVDVPVLYLVGHDTRASARCMAELLNRTLPDVELTTLSGMGHLGPITHAEIVAQRIARFIRQQALSRVLLERNAA